jgi:hypothetical protein
LTKISEQSVKKQSYAISNVRLESFDRYIVRHDVDGILSIGMLLTWQHGISYLLTFYFVLRGNNILISGELRRSFDMRIERILFFCRNVADFWLIK